MRRARWLLSIGPILAAACSRGQPPAPEGSPSVALPELAAPSAAAGPSAAASGGAPTPASAAAPAPSIDPATLPQTRDRPAASGPAFDARVAALWDGIVKDDPEEAMAFFFPLPAYQQVKDIGDPASDWKHRLVAAYTHDIHALHARLGEGAPAFERIEVPEARGRWVDPGEEYNKIGYYRVFGSRMHYRSGDEERSFEIKSMISWRGEWYVVHLSAIR